MSLSRISVMLRFAGASRFSILGRFVLSSNDDCFQSSFAGTDLRELKVEGLRSTDWCVTRVTANQVVKVNSLQRCDTEISRFCLSKVFVTRNLCGVTGSWQSPLTTYHHSTSLNQSIPATRILTLKSNVQSCYVLSANARFKPN